ncbi:MAG: radical SAM protein [Chitinivibrionales bacterium]|nr:radical SAM protein [Chitinivibrionales bacterium]
MFHYKPLLLHYFITNRCNARCSFCDIWCEKPKADAQLANVKINLRHARSAGCRFVDFTGGEPLLNSELPAFLLHAKQLGFITSVTTNCLLFEQRAAELAGLVDLLHFSIDADTAAHHDRIRGVASFRQVVNAIPLALHHDLVPDLLFTYTDENIDAVEGVYAYAKTYRLMLILDPVFATESSDTVTVLTHQKARRFARRPGVYLNPAHLRLRKQGGNQPDRPACRAVTSTVVILPDNRLALPCYHHFSNTIALQGNLLEELQNTLRLNAERYQGKYPFCNGCHINCYFDPSFSSQINRLTLLSSFAKLKYAFWKYVIYKRKLPVLRKGAVM